jgi:hypothetical protein
MYLFTILAICSPTLQAQIVEIAITAEVSLIDDPCNLLGGQVNLGDTITGSYIYDLSTPDATPDPESGIYWHYNSPFGIYLNAGPFVFQSDPDNVEFLMQIVNDEGPSLRDVYLFNSYNNLNFNEDVFVDNISWQLNNTGGEPFSSDQLPAGPPPLGVWQDDYGLNIRAGVYIKHESDFVQMFHISSEVVSLQLIPEPATIFLTGFGAIALLNKRSRRS